MTASITTWLFCTGQIKLLTNKCNITVSFLCWRNSKLIMNIIQSMQWFFLLRYIFIVVSRCIVGQYFYFFIDLALNFVLPFVRIDLSMPCLLNHVSMQSLRPFMMLPLALSHEMLLCSLCLSPY